MMYRVKYFQKLGHAYLTFLDDNFFKFTEFNPSISINFMKDGILRPIFSLVEFLFQRQAVYNSEGQKHHINDKIFDENQR